MVHKLGSVRLTFAIQIRKATINRVDIIVCILNFYYLIQIQVIII